MAESSIKHIKSVIEVGLGTASLSQCVCCLFAALLLGSYFEYQVDIKSQFIIMSHIPDVLTVEFFKAEIPKLLTAFAVRETRKHLNICYYMVFVAVFLCQLFVSILYYFHSVMIERKKKCFPFFTHNFK